MYFCIISIFVFISLLLYQCRKMKQHPVDVCTLIKDPKEQVLPASQQHTLKHDLYNFVQSASLRLPVMDIE